jgi:hypothetical protein
MDIPIAAHRRILHFTTGSRRTGAAGRRSRAGCCRCRDRPLRRRRGSFEVVLDERVERRGGGVGGGGRRRRGRRAGAVPAVAGRGRGARPSRCRCGSARAWACGRRCGGRRGGPVRGNNPSALTGRGRGSAGAERVASNRLSNTPTRRRARRPGAEDEETRVFPRLSVQVGPEGLPPENEAIGSNPLGRIPLNPTRTVTYGAGFQLLGGEQELQKQAAIDHPARLPTGLVTE